MPTITPTTLAPAIVTRYVGRCPICEGDFKLTTDAIHGNFGDGQKMVHHGYQRPGDGSGIIGDCYAVGRPAYEESCDVTREYRDVISRQRANLIDLVRRLESGEVTEIMERSWRRGEAPTIHRIGDAVWPRELAGKIRETQGMICSLDLELERLTGLINAWVAKPLRTIEEYEAPIKSERERKAAQRKADYQARTDAVLASYQKRLATALRKKTVSTFAEIFETAPSKLGDRGMTRKQVFAALGHADVFAALGLDLEADSCYGGKNYELTSSMRYGSNKYPWPASLST